MIEFIKESHTYLVDGVITPSVSQILAATIFKNKYANIPEFIMKRAAHYGTNVHNAIELNDWIGLTDEEYIAYDNYQNLVKTHKINVISHEQVVVYQKYYIGRYDMEAWVGDDKCLIDIKTTYKLDMEYLSWQLSMYELAKGIRYDKLFVIWLTKKGNSELVEIERKSESEIMGLIKLYEDSCEQD